MQLNSLLIKILLASVASVASADDSSNSGLAPEQVGSDAQAQHLDARYDLIRMPPFQTKDECMDATTDCEGSCYEFSDNCDMECFKKFDE
ncbi:hypothetical protein E4U55_000339 [Claviceps digitariae]|nr:hypothetical protein E4U55_000339 [Claviceps digitariae]